jgi:hypothetical protein
MLDSLSSLEGSIDSSGSGSYCQQEGSVVKRGRTGASPSALAA